MKKKIKNILLITLGVVLGLTVGVKAATTIASTSVTYGDKTVKDALDELIGIANQCSNDALCSKVKIGDYVSMTPTSTSYTILGELTGFNSTQIISPTGEYKDRTINPSELNLWRVIDIRNDGTIEMVSEYISSTQVVFQGLEGYINYVGILNLIANQYGNSKYTIGARHIGYNGQTATITDTSKFTTSAPWTDSTWQHNNQYEALGGGDVMYEYDINNSTGLVAKALGTLVATTPAGATKSYFLASRTYGYSSDTYYMLSVPAITITGNIGYANYGLAEYNSGWKAHQFVAAIRPIVTLHADITSFTGSGTSDSPWVLS